jgi:tetraacyldisaccharide 4'-kinase
MLMAESLPHASVLVSENRLLAIELAIRKDAKMIILDDGFSQVSIDKFDIILEPSCPPNSMTFPAGPLREFGFMKSYADLVLKEDSDFKRVVSFENLTKRMLLVTAIANPQRLDRYLPEGVIGHYYLEDHSYFDEDLLNEQLLLHNATSLLVTQKDAVKMKGFKLPLSLMKLELKLKDTCFQSVDNYLESDNVK